jgi:hypothetical protein
MPSSSHHVELPHYAYDKINVATSHKPTLLISYLELYFNYPQPWLSELRKDNISKSIAIIFARAGRRFIHPGPVTLFG